MDGQTHGLTDIVMYTPTITANKYVMFLFLHITFHYIVWCKAVINGQWARLSNFNPSAYMTSTRLRVVCWLASVTVHLLAPNTMYISFFDWLEDQRIPKGSLEMKTKTNS